MSNRHIAFFAAALAAGLAGCGGAGDSRIVVRLVDAPGDFQEINVDVQKVEIHSTTGGWITLSQPNEVVNLLSLTNGVAKTLADTTIPAGTYEQMRLLLGSNNTVKVNGTVYPLVVPSGLQTGIKLPLSFTVAANTTKDVFIDFNGQKSVFVHGTGNGEYILRPVVRAFDQLATGAVKGVLTDAATNLPLAGVTVMAEEVTTTSVPDVARTVTTLADGSYVLDLLDVDHTFHVVSQPVAGSTSYLAKASGPFTITAAAPVLDYSAAFTSVAQAGGISGAITPTATVNDVDTVTALQVLDGGDGARPYVIRFANGVVAGTPAAESYSVPNLPPGAFSVFAERRALDPATGIETTSDSPQVAATVTAGATTTANLAIPAP
jgi:hypothetical protein